MRIRRQSQPAYLFKINKGNTRTIRTLLKVNNKDIRQTMGYWPTPGKLPPPQKKIKKLEQNNLQQMKKHKWNLKKINLNTDLNTHIQCLTSAFVWPYKTIIPSLFEEVCQFVISLKKLPHQNIVPYHWVCICISTNQQKFSENWYLFSKRFWHLEVANNIWYTILKYNNIWIAWKIKKKK